MEELYALYRESFFRWAGKRFNANRQDFEDAWQEAVTAFYLQVSSGKLVSLRHEVRTWLFAVGYKRLLNNNRKLKRILWRDHIDEALQQDAFQPEWLEKHETSANRESLKSAMKAMSSQCREMLVQRYFLEQSLEEIQQNWELNSANTTSATLSRCLKRLKELIKTVQSARV